MAEVGRRVCVTGAGGYVGSCLVKLLLSQGYQVNATLRNPGDDDKNGHLQNLENAGEKLKLFKADLLDFDSILAAVEGCDGVFHVASPVPSGSVPNPEVEVVEPALKGTLNVLKACSKARVRRVVIVSSVVAIIVNPSWAKDQVMDESCWSDKEYCRTTNNWYYYSKTVAEDKAWEYAKESGLDIVTVCPGLVVGPMLQHSTNASSLALIKLLREGYEEMQNNTWLLVDVRDVAEAMKLVYEKPEAEGRYICTSHVIRVQDMVQNLKEIYPSYSYPKSFKEGKDVKISSEKLQRLGWKYKLLWILLRTTNRMVFSICRLSSNSAG
ncbi:hypothetical protein ACS0TY_027430 [Phlomoides rotata]